MKIKLLSPSLKKIILSIILIIFAPLPFFAVAMMGFAPPILILLFMFMPAIGISPLVVVLSVLFFAIHALFAYFVACVIIWIFEKIIENEAKRWFLILSLSVLLVVISFFHIYGVADVGGGFQKPNIEELFFEWTKS